MRSFVICLLVVSSLPVATAGPKLLAADKHNPPVALDPTSIWVQIVPRNDAGYIAKGWFRIQGATSKSDRLRIDLKQGGKVVGTGKCNTSYNENFKTLRGGCELEKEVKAKGAVELEVVYEDDQDDKHYSVAALKLDVRQWKGIGKTIEWGYVPDDVLALGYVRHDDDGGTYKSVPIFEFWSTAQMGAKGAQFRCTVDGKKLPDFDASIGNRTGSDQTEISSVWTTEKTRKAYTFYHYGVDPGFKWGTKEQFSSGGYDATKVRFALDTPGKWDCTLRVEGKPFRKFAFTVDAKGMIVASDLQGGTWAVKPTPEVVVVDMRIPDDNGYEQRIRQDALKKSVGWGIAWPVHAKAKEAQGAFPKTMGTPD